MKWRELLLTLPPKFSDSEKRYLMENSLEEALLAVPMTEDVKQYKDLLYRTSEEHILQTIRGTNLTPGALTTYMRLLTCEFMQTRIPHCDGVIGCLSFIRKFISDFGRDTRYIEPGNPIEWMLTEGGEPVLFYARGSWYNRLGPVSASFLNGQYYYSLYMLDGKLQHYNPRICNECKRKHIREYPRRGGKKHA